MNNHILQKDYIKHDLVERYNQTLLMEDLENHKSFDHNEEAARLTTLYFLRSMRSNPYERNNLDGHITTSAWVIDKKEEYALLVHHRKLKFWMQPGGHCDDDSDVFAGALREVKEETGLSPEEYMFSLFDVDVHAIPAQGTEPAHIHYDIRFLMKADKNLPLIVSPESLDVKWFSLHEIIQGKNPLISKSILRLAQKTTENDFFAKGIGAKS